MQERYARVCAHYRRQYPLGDTNDAAFARTVIALANSLGLSIIAESLETDAQRSFLASEGCRTYQGYRFSRPVPITEFDALVSPPIEI